MVIAQMKNLRVFFDWAYLTSLVVASLFSLLIIFSLAFIIYYEDHKQNMNKRTFKPFEIIIQRFFEKGVNQ